MMNIPYGELTEEQREYVNSPDLIDNHFACISGWAQEVFASDYERSESTLLRATLARCADDPAIVETLSRDPEPFVRSALAARGIAPQLAGDLDPRVQQAARDASTRGSEQPVRSRSEEEGRKAGSPPRGAGPALSRPTALSASEPSRSGGSR